jgi:Holliday junction resolvasome RuvABC ATP-dependent DNA helicase subunit
MFKSLIGQDHIKRQLGFYQDVYSSTGVVPFLMFNGAKGLGKTEFAKSFAAAIGKPMLEINCSTIKNSKQFFDQIFIPIIMDSKITVLFDECHALPKDLVMSFLTVFNTEKSNKKRFDFEESSFEFDFEKQSYIFSTSEPDKLFPPFKDRLTVIDFKQYSEEDLGKILQSRTEGIKISPEIIDEISHTLRGNARSAVKRSKEIVMYCESRNSPIFGMKQWEELCSLVDILPLGLTNSEVEILRVLKQRGDSTLSALSASTGLSRTAIQRDSESYLTKMNLIKIDGTRKITSKGILILGTIKD